MITLLLGIVLGWLIPRPTYFGRIESKVWTNLKIKTPDWLRWWN